MKTARRITQAHIQRRKQDPGEAVSILGSLTRFISPANKQTIQSSSYQFITLKTQHLNVSILRSSSTCTNPAPRRKYQEMKAEILIHCPTYILKSQPQISSLHSKNTVTNQPYYSCTLRELYEKLNKMDNWYMAAIYLEQNICIILLQYLHYVNWLLVGIKGQLCQQFKE